PQLWLAALGAQLSGRTPARHPAGPVRTARRAPAGGRDGRQRVPDAHVAGPAVGQTLALRARPATAVIRPLRAFAGAPWGHSPEGGGSTRLRHARGAAAAGAGREPDGIRGTVRAPALRRAGIGHRHAQGVARQAAGTTALAPGP